ncbi:hypothetical protein DNU06_11340 [Putridiphycobacter roseus]|uniref:DUF4340 domain-containing protein n=1 Tax=Putridiphycobacter roseus TaxID=2219161 RepID=A0A2W1NCP1_9FLAO|nr:hypothetical protein [Putridiphycobacter roseus]PZE16843.1 hypothetical protein DNU06_11340 [Putridiphycobacter roseus]
MKKIIPFLLLFVLIGLGVYTYFLLNTEKSSLSKNALSDFAIKDTASITRIVISSSMGDKVDFAKKDGKWQYIDGACIQQHMIHNFLETIKYIAVKAPVPKGAVENVTKQTLGQHKKLEIYVDGKLAKTWYIGSATADHYGTYMILENEGEGISPEPFITFMPNVYGNLADQFSIRKKDYECSGIFNYDLKNIKRIEVVVHQDSSVNFEVGINGENIFELTNNTKPVSDFDTTKIRSFVANFKKMHYDTKEPIMPLVLRDSILNSAPYYTVTVTDKNGVENTMITYLKPIEFEKYDYNGDLIIYDQTNLFAVIRKDQFVEIQYFVFDKIFKDVNYFKIK